MDMEDIVFNVRDHTINLSHKKLTPQGITNILRSEILTITFEMNESTFWLKVDV